MLLCLQSDQSEDVYPGNTCAAFACVLPERYDLDTHGKGQWFLGLTEITLPPIKSSKKCEPIYVCCRQCETSSIGRFYKPVVASFSVGEIKRNGFVRFSPVHYVPLRVDSLEHLSVELCDCRGEIFRELTESGQPSKCSFDLKWTSVTNPWRP